MRVRPFKPRIQQQAPIPDCMDCKRPIQAAMGKSAAYMARYTQKNYGVPLCAGCAQKRKNAQAHIQPPESETESNILPEGDPTAVPEPGEVL